MQRRDPRVFDPEFLELRPGTEGYVRDLPHGPPVAAADDTQVRDEGEPDQAIGLAPDHPRIDRIQLLLGHPVDHRAEDGVPARQAGEPRSPLPGPLGHPDEGHALIPDPDRAGIEHADDLIMVARRGEVLRPQQEPGGEAADGHRPGPA